MKLVKYTQVTNNYRYFAFFFADCNLNLKERYGGTALQVASKHGHLKCSEILISAGAQLDKCDNKRQSPFFGNKF